MKKRLAKTKRTRKPPRRRKPVPRDPAPRRIIEGGVAWLSLAEAAERLGVDRSRMYKIIAQKGGGGLTLMQRTYEGRPVRYATLVSVDQYRRRAQAWKDLHGRTHGRA